MSMGRSPGLKQLHHSGQAALLSHQGMAFGKGFPTAEVGSREDVCGSKVKRVRVPPPIVFFNRFFWFVQWLQLILALLKMFFVKGF